MITKTETLTGETVENFISAHKDRMKICIDLDGRFVYANDTEFHAKKSDVYRKIVTSSNVIVFSLMHVS